MKPWQRAITPIPATLPIADARRLESVRERLRHALRVSTTLAVLRTYVAELACDLKTALSEAEAPTLTPYTEEPADPLADTQRMIAAPWDDDCAPPTPRASTLGEEYGV